MISSSSLRYLSLSSSTKRRCLCRGSSCFLRASAMRTFISASVRFNKVRTESWFSSCRHTYIQTEWYRQHIVLLIQHGMLYTQLVYINYLCHCYLLCMHKNGTRRRTAAVYGFSKETSVICSNCRFLFPIAERLVLMHIHSPLSYYARRTFGSILDCLCASYSLLVSF